jgi:TonB family protein
MDAVSEVLIARAHPSAGFDRMVGASFVAHAALAAVVILGPAAWWGQRDKQPETVMQVSLGGPEGPPTGGLTTLGARPIQQVTPVAPKQPVEAVRPPADRTPEMIDPTKAPPKKTPDNKVEAKDPRSRTPTKGAELQKGSAVAETGSKSTSTGLSFGAGGAGGTLDVANFCCPEYLATMREFILRNWDFHQQTQAVTKLHFVIQKDGRLADIEIERSSGNANLDFLARRALMLTQLPPLPAGYDQQVLGVHMSFEYQK